MVPDGWSEKPLARLLEKVIDYRGVSVPKAENGIPLITARNIKLGFLDFSEQEFIKEDLYDNWVSRGIPNGNDILFTTEAPLGNACRFPAIGKYAIGQRTVCLRANYYLHPEFLLQFLLSAKGRKSIELRSSGSTAKGIKSSELKKVQLLHPSSVPEQKKIAKILSSWDQAITTTEQLLSNCQRQKKALAQQLLVGKLRLSEFGKNTERQKTKYGEIPAEWKFISLGSVANQISTKNTEARDLPVLSCSKHDGFVDSLKYFKKKIYSDDTSTYKIIEKGCFGFPSNHIEEGSIGYQNLYDTAIVSPIYIIFKANCDLVNNLFLYALLKTEHYRQIFSAATNSSVDRRGSLRWDEFSKIKIQLPSLEEQKAIVNTLSTAEHEIEVLQQKLTCLKQEKKSLMQKLLTGRSRVKVEVA